MAPSPAFSEVQSASRTPGLWIALSHQVSVKPSIGQVCERDELNA